tara:strand:- start:4370 stop:5053 length:684 start_codon:yes stop_codon:yes gene_type:complete
MSELTNEYLDNLIKKKLFKDFSLWEKDDFHFLLTLFNYPNYTDLALVILSNLKNWITYSNGIFFYPIEKLQKILDKYYVQKDIFEEVNEEQNIKVNIQKKNTESKYSDDLLNIDLDNGLLNIGQFMSIDTFKFLICTIIFFIIFSIINLINYNSSNNYVQNEPNKKWNKPLFNNYLNDFKEMNNFDDMFNLEEKNDNTQKFNNLFENFPKNESIVKTVLKYLTKYIL